MIFLGLQKFLNGTVQAKNLVFVTFLLASTVSCGLLDKKTANIEKPSENNPVQKENSNTQVQPSSQNPTQSSKSQVENNVGTTNVGTPVGTSAESHANPQDPPPTFPEVSEDLKDINTSVLPKTACQITLSSDYSEKDGMIAAGTALLDTNTPQQETQGIHNHYGIVTPHGIVQITLLGKVEASSSCKDSQKLSYYLVNSGIESLSSRNDFSQEVCKFSYEQKKLFSPNSDLTLKDNIWTLVNQPIGPECGASTSTIYIPSWTAHINTSNVKISGRLSKLSVVKIPN